MNKNQPIALITDFDGTISKKDFFWYAIDQYLEEKDMQPWEDYKSDKIRHVEALRRIFSKIHVEQEEFDQFVLNLEIEEDFPKTVEFCKDNNIPISILSAGADYYINIILKRLGFFDFIEVISNKSYYSKEDGLCFCPSDKNYKYYSEEFGISKKDFVANKKAEGYFCIFAGDGRPDIEAAKLADVVFARKDLKKLCIENDIEFQQFNTYGDILSFLQTLKSLEDCR